MRRPPVLQKAAAWTAARFNTLAWILNSLNKIYHTARYASTPTTATGTRSDYPPPQRFSDDTGIDMALVLNDLLCGYRIPDRIRTYVQNHPLYHDNLPTDCGHPQARSR